MGLRTQTAEAQRHQLQFESLQETLAARTDELTRLQQHAAEFASSKDRVRLGHREAQSWRLKLIDWDLGRQLAS